MKYIYCFSIGYKVLAALFPVSISLFNYGVKNGLMLSVALFYTGKKIMRQFPFLWQENIGEAPRMKMTLEVTIIIAVETDGYYIATCKELPEFLTGGESIDEVFENIPEALLLTIESYRHTKHPLPDEIIIEEDLPKPLFTTLTPKGRQRKDSYNLWFKAKMPAEDYQVYAS